MKIARFLLFAGFVFVICHQEKNVESIEKNNNNNKQTSFIVCLFLCCFFFLFFSRVFVCVVVVFALFFFLLLFPFLFLDCRGQERRPKSLKCLSALCVF